MYGTLYTGFLLLYYHIVHVRHIIYWLSLALLPLYMYGTLYTGFLLFYYHCTCTAHYILAFPCFTVTIHVRHIIYWLSDAFLPLYGTLYAGFPLLVQLFCHCMAQYIPAFPCFSATVIHYRFITRAICSVPVERRHLFPNDKRRDSR